MNKHSFDRELLILAEGKTGCRVFSLEEARQQGISVSCRPVKNTSDGYGFMEFSFDSKDSEWLLQEVRWRFTKVSSSEEDLLYLPEKGGAVWRDPAALLFEEMKFSEGCWRDRKFWLRESGLLTPDKKDAQENCVEIRCSMPFFSYNSSRGALSAFFLDKGFEVTFIRVSGKRSRKEFDIELAKSFNRDVRSWSCTLVLGEHEKDWHQDARLYKSFYDTLDLGIRTPIPLGTGVHAHYDLKWQDGVIHRNYADLPRLADEAAADGFDTMVFGGWNEGGFDNNYPCFRPDPQLGGEAELIRAVDAIHNKGLKVLLYVNGFSYDRSRAAYETEGAPCAIRFADGSTRDVRWGNKVLTGMCMGSAAWRDIVCDNVRYVCEVLKADGLYLDQFNVIPPRCHAEGHDHSAGAVAGILNAFRQVRSAAGEDKIFITEHPLDALNSSVDYQDLETVWNNQALTFPELFCYTFPEAGRMDLLIQKPWPCTDPEVEGRHLVKNYNRLFLTGTKLWCYGHASKTEGFREHFLLGQKLRKKYDAFFSKGLYRHTEHLARMPEKVEAAWYDLPGSQAMVVVANMSGASCALELDDGGKVPCTAEALQVILLPKTDFFSEAD